ncbi:hypothetical protein MMC06_000308 [Schaereria dolodes]|nr:hypothetical protein [Schaereria dolodes]
MAYEFQEHSDDDEELINFASYVGPFDQIQEAFLAKNRSRARGSREAQAAAKERRDREQQEAQAAADLAARRRRAGQQADRKEQEERRKARQTPRGDSVPKKSPTELEFQWEADICASGDQWKIWSTACQCLANPITLLRFPNPPGYHCKMVNDKQNSCLKAEHLKICHHDLERTLRGSGMYSYEFLRKLTFKFHPDKFSACPEEVREEMKIKAQEVFQLLRKLIEMEQKC